MNKFAVGLVNVARHVFRPFMPVKVFGETDIPNKKCLVVGNHQSGWDSVIYTMWTKNIIPVVYKAEFDKVNFLHWVFTGLDCVPVHRGEVDMTATKGILRLLKQDKAVLMFPEGTRNPNYDCLQEFHTGAAMFALKTHAPIRPFYIWDKGKFLHKNYMIVGDEFTLDEFYDKPLDRNTLEEATAVIWNKVNDLRIKLNAILDERGVKRRPRTRKEMQRIQEYNEKQAMLAEQESTEAGSKEE